MKIDENNIRQIIKSLEHNRNSIEHAILLTPTSDRRNKLCDASIHLTAAIAHLATLYKEPCFE